MNTSDSQVSAAKVGAILQHTPNGVLLVDRDTKIHFVNPAFRTMFHCGDEELLGRPAAGFVHSDCFERAIAAGGNLMVKETIPEHDVSFRVGLFISLAALALLGAWALAIYVGRNDRR